MAAYFALELDTTAPEVDIGTHSWNEASGTFEVPITTNDPEAEVSATVQFDSGTVYPLTRIGNVFSVTLGAGFVWGTAGVTVTAIDPVWNSTTLIETWGTERRTSITYVTFERYPMTLEEFLRFHLRLTEESQHRVSLTEDDQHRLKLTEDERYPIDLDE